MQPTQRQILNFFYLINTNGTFRNLVPLTKTVPQVNINLKYYVILSTYLLDTYIHGQKIRTQIMGPPQLANAHTNYNYYFNFCFHLYFVKYTHTHIHLINKVPVYKQYQTSKKCRRLVGWLPGWRDSLNGWMTELWWSF